MPTPDSTRRDRAWFPEVEALKAVAIVAVVTAHGGREWWLPGRTHFESWMDLVTTASVPCFLFCSGFLYAGSGPVGWEPTRRRLSRLLAPYLLASFLAQVFRRHVLGKPVTAPLRELLICDAFGIYYYVFVIVSLTLCTPLLSRLPRRLLWVVTLFFVSTGAVRSLAQWTPEIEREIIARGLSPAADFATALRNPILSWCYFLVGYAFRLDYGRVLGWFAPRRRALSAALWGTLVCVLGGLAFADIGRWMFLGYPLLYLLLATFVVTWFGRIERLGAWTRFLASNTYLIYLYHLFFVLGARRIWPQPPDGFSPLYYVLHVALGLGGPLLLAGVVQRMPVPLRAWFGATPVPSA